MINLNIIKIKEKNQCCNISDLPPNYVGYVNTFREKVNMIVE